MNHTPTPWKMEVKRKRSDRRRYNEHSEAGNYSSMMMARGRRPTGRKELITQQKLATD